MARALYSARNPGLAKGLTPSSPNSIPAWHRDSLDVANASIPPSSLEIANHASTILISVENLEALLLHAGAQSVDRMHQEILQSLQKTVRARDIVTPVSPGAFQITFSNTDSSFSSAILSRISARMKLCKLLFGSLLYPVITVRMNWDARLAPPPSVDALPAGSLPMDSPYSFPGPG
jgi:hypothetical protein